MEKWKSREDEVRERDWRAQLKEDCKTFVSDTSMHGVKYVTDKNRSKFGRILWLLIVLFMAGYLIYNLVFLYRRYKSYPFVTESTISQRDSLPVPGISLCLRDPLQRSRLRHLPHSDVIEDVLLYQRRDFDNETLRSILSGVTMQEMMDVGSFKVEEIIKEVSVGSIGLNKRYFDVRSSFYTWDAPFGYTGFPFRCFIFNITNSLEDKESVVKMNTLEQWKAYLTVPLDDLLPFDDTGGVFAVIHEPWEVPLGNSMTMMPGSSVSILLRKSEFSFLPAPYLSHNEEDCEQVEEPDYVSPLPLSPRYSITNCIAEAMVGDGVQKCSCTSAALGDLKTPQCSLLQHFTCFQPVSQDAFEKALSECRITCTVHQLQTKLSTVRPYPSNNILPYLRAIQVVNNDTKPEDLLKVTVNFESTMVEVTEHKPELTIDGIYSILGGQLGLFLGASLLTITELVEHVGYLFWSMLVCLAGKKGRTAASSS